LSTRTNNALAQSFVPNDLNQLSSVSRSGTFTVAGALSDAASSVTVQHNGGAIQTATQYSDKTYVRDGISLTSGNNTFAVTGVSTGGPQHSVSLTLNLPASVSFVHDDNGNMTGDGGRAFEYDDENQLKAAQVAGVWRTEFVYDGFGRLRVRKEFTWSGSAWAAAGETRYLYDGMRVIQERSGNNTPLVSYTRPGVSSLVCSLGS
jgi:YD repeat-containing protein